MVDNNNHDAEGPEEPQEPEETEDLEVVEADSVDNGQTNRTPSEEFDRIGTYSTRENGILYQVNSQITNLGTKWEIRVYGSAQGAIIFEDGISDEQAEHLGLSPETQGDLNATLQRAKEVGHLPRVFRGQKREKRQLGELQEALGM